MPPIVNLRQFQRRRPLLIRAYNSIGKNGPLHPAALLDTAARRTGLTDFGDDLFREPLEKLVQSINEEARLHPFGRFISRERLVNLLGNRLRATEFRKQHPEIAEQKIQAPIVITGLQRTGTTFLHRLLAADPNLRALRSWEALHPAPLQWPVSDRDPRIGKARTAERALRYMSPEFFAIHPVEHNAPEEEILLLDNSLRSTVPEATLHVPGFAAWIETQDHRPAYDMLYHLLQLLQWQQPGKRWVLKTPHHLEFLDVLFQVFPDAKVIHTHRNPLETMGSFCSMVYFSRHVFSDEVDRHEIGRHWLRKTAHMVRRARDFQQENPKAAILDVNYADLVENPLPIVQKIYEFAGQPLTPETESALMQALALNRQHKYGKHQYQLSDFGLDEAAVSEVYNFH
ncbi:MAG: sulfotransferase [Lewinellaceae bacterium]|nr:sulfotransferase [Lewinellaceae bacterium]